MKIFRLITCLLMLIFAGVVRTGGKEDCHVVYVRGFFHLLDPRLVYHLDILTPEGVNHGVYKEAGSGMGSVGYLELVSWTGSGTPPSLYLGYC